MMEFENMSELLVKLIDNAKKLREASSKSIVEGEFELLQVNQQAMIEELTALDELIKQKKIKASSALHDKVQAQLIEFQKINKEYVEYLRTRLSLIQFSTPHNGEEETI